MGWDGAAFATALGSMLTVWLVAWGLGLALSIFNHGGYDK